MDLQGAGQFLVCKWTERQRLDSDVVAALQGEDLAFAHAETQQLAGCTSNTEIVTTYRGTLNTSTVCALHHYPRQSWNYLTSCHIDIESLRKGLRLASTTLAKSDLWKGRPVLIVPTLDAIPMADGNLQYSCHCNPDKNL